MRRYGLSLVLAFSCMMVIGACSLIGDGDEVESTETPVTVTPEATPIPLGTPGVSSPITVTEQSATLTIWIPPELTEQTEGGIDIFSDQVRAFAANHPGLETRIEQKPVAGQGGILSYLRTGHEVAPTILPDLVALPTTHLSQAVAENMIFPLDDLIAPDLLDDLFPAAESMARLDNQIIAYPFALTALSHIAYNKSVITASLPLTWTQLVEEALGTFIFPAAGEAGAMMTLQIYLALGGTLVNEVGQPGLQSEPLANALTLFSQGRSANFIALHSSNVSTLDESWQFFQSGSAALAQTTADQFLRERSGEQISGFTPIPGPQRALTPLVNGWVWAVTTGNLAQKALAVELLSLLVAEPDYGEWSVQSGILPSRRQAFARWPSNDPYTTFLQQELERAQPNPVAGSNAIISALGDAVFGVISLSLSPQAAADAAVASLQP